MQGLYGGPFNDGNATEYAAYSGGWSGFKIQEPAYLSCVFDRVTGTGCARDRRQAGSHRRRGVGFGYLTQAAIGTLVAIA